MNKAKVVVVGSGSSGIAAATKLLELGFQNVQVLESENRIGGRTYSFPFADNVIDMGAQFIHGEKGNVVYELASQHNLLEHIDPEFLKKYEFIRSNKEVLSESVALRLKAITDNIEGPERKGMENYDGSVGSYIKSKYFEALKKSENSDIDSKIAKEFYDSYERVGNSINACDTMNDLSAKRFLDSWDVEGDGYMVWKGAGYLGFLKLLLKSSTEGKELGVLDQKIKLRKAVQAISWNDEGVKVKCVDGDVIEADHVIVTVSLGVLKEKHMTLFEPSLPATKIRAIETIGFGTINNIYLEFPNQFWPKYWPGFTLLWREEDLAEIRGTSQAWLEDMSEVFMVSHQPRVLCGWVVSANARHIETLSKDELQSGLMYVLKKFLKWDIPSPINCTGSSWSTSESFRGSYSFQSMLTEEAGTKPSNLAAPILNSEEKPVVLFAGEATHDHYFGTVHGAVETGWREAKRLGDYYSTKPSEVKK